MRFSEFLQPSHRLRPVRGFFVSAVSARATEWRPLQGKRNRVPPHNPHQGGKAFPVVPFPSMKTNMSKKRNAPREASVGTNAASSTSRINGDPVEAELVDGARGRLGVAARIVISGLLAFHVLAVAIFPLAFATQNASPSVMSVAGWMRPYGEALCLDHGYFFFAPNPGPSHLVQYRLEFDDGRPPMEGRFPDLKQHWPRLWYHRHFMLAEHLNAHYIPPEPPAEANQQELARWQAARASYERHLRAFEQHLLEKHGADRVTLVRLEHAIPFPDEYEDMLDQGIRLDDPQSFVPLDEPRASSRGAAAP
jgi:hypothetical protein